MNFDSSSIIALGEIERFDEHGVAWGTFDNGNGFDIPIDAQFHAIGDKVRFGTTEPTEELPSDYMMMVFGQKYASILWMSESPQGYEIDELVVINRDGEPVAALQDIPSLH